MRGEYDDPDDAIDVVHTIMEHDLIVMGSDGFFDNIFDSEIQKIVKNHSNHKGVIRKNPQILADNLAKKAEEHRSIETRKSPTSRYEGNKIDYPKGGKQDISVIVSLIRFSPWIEME
jgi:hypothetical protein